MLTIESPLSSAAFLRVTTYSRRAPSGPPYTFTLSSRPCLCLTFIPDVRSTSYVGSRASIRIRAPYSPIRASDPVATPWSSLLSFVMPQSPPCLSRSRSLHSASKQPPSRYVHSALTPLNNHSLKTQNHNSASLATPCPDCSICVFRTQSCRAPRASNPVPHREVKTHLYGRFSPLYNCGAGHKTRPLRRVSNHTIFSGDKSQADFVLRSAFDHHRSYIP